MTSDELVQVETRPCPVCKQIDIIAIPIKAYAAMGRGKLIQEAWPDSTPDQREMVITGTHPQCFDAMFPEEAEE